MVTSLNSFVAILLSCLCLLTLSHQHRNMNAVDAVVGFLRKVRNLDTYGTRLYGARFEESSSELGISPGGVAVFRRGKRIVFHDWTTVAEVSFKNKKFLIMVSGMGVRIQEIWNEIMEN